MPLPGGLEASALSQNARLFITEEVARKVWRDWNPEQPDRVESPAFLRQLCAVLREGASLGLRLSRFRELLLKLPETGTDWAPLFEDVVALNDCSGVRLQLNREQYASFANPGEGGLESWDREAGESDGHPVLGARPRLPADPVTVDDALVSPWFRCEWKTCAFRHSVVCPAIAAWWQDSVERLQLLNIAGEPARHPVTRRGVCHGRGRLWHPCAAKPVWRRGGPPSICPLRSLRLSAPLRARS